MKNKFKIFVILLFGILLFSLVPHASADYSVYASFRDAYYADLDGDNFQDDIRLELSLDLYNSYETTNVDLYIDITLPSGTVYSFLVHLILVKSTTHGYYELSVNIYNAATESGWYTASTVAFTPDDLYSIQETIVFDPPGSNGGVPPSIEIV